MVCQSAGLNGAVAKRGAGHQRLCAGDPGRAWKARRHRARLAHLIDRLIAAGLLVRLSDHVMTTNKGFHVAWPRNRVLSESAEKVRDWLAAQA
jgi:DNA-binding transcriptional LysR family regulator